MDYAAYTVGPGVQHGYHWRGIVCCVVPPPIWGLILYMYQRSSNSCGGGLRNLTDSAESMSLRRLSQLAMLMGLQ
jgi:hypothetical protein